MRDDVLRAELRRAAARHLPDRTVMLNRIAAGRGPRATGPRLTVRSRGVRLAGAALAVTTMLGVGGVARWALADEHEPDPVPAARPHVTAPASPSSSPPVSAPASPPAPSATARPSRSATSTPSGDPPPWAAGSRSALPVRGHPGDTQVEKGSLRSDGSVGPAGTGPTGQSTVTLNAAADLTELDLTIRVVQTPGLADQDTAGGVTAPGVTGTVERRDGALLFRFRLLDGATLPAGTYVLTARYRHDGGRDAGPDTYEAFATDVDHKRLHVYGNFHPAN